MATGVYQGRKVTLGGARHVKGITPKGKKVSHFYKDPKTGKVRVVHAGAVGYSDYTKHKSEKRRKNFHARHNCSEAKPHTPKWVACKFLW